VDVSAECRQKSVASYWTGGGEDCQGHFQPAWNSQCRAQTGKVNRTAQPRSRCRAKLKYRLLGAAVISASFGAHRANRCVRKVVFAVLQRDDTALLVLVAVGLIAGVL